MKVPVVDVPTFLDRVGHAHDVRIESLEWSPGTRSLILKCDDIFSALEGKPQYLGAVPVALSIDRVQSWNASVKPSDNYLSISRMDVELDGAHRQFKFQLWLQGDLVVVAENLWLEFDPERPGAAMLAEILKLHGQHGVGLP